MGRAEAEAVWRDIPGGRVSKGASGKGPWETWDKSWEDLLQSSFCCGR